VLYSKSSEGEMVKSEGGNDRPNRMAVKKSDISLILKNNTKVLNNQ
jgi:hypothetical protein